MGERTVDVAVIGAGTAGLAAFRAARRTTDDVLLIEGGAHGTLCARVGCMPSKLLIAAADTTQTVRSADTFGVRVPSFEVDGQKVMRRLHAWRDHFVDGILAEVDSIPDREKLDGMARFIGQNTLAVDTDAGETTVNAHRIVIATGSHPTVPDRYADLARIVTSDDLFGWHDLPGSVAVLGGGIIGLELGQALSRLGVSVRVLGKDGLVGPLTDPQVLEAARAIFTRALDFLPHFDEDDVREGPDGVTLDYRVDGQNHRTTFDRLLVAIGREPSLGALSLDNSGLSRDETGVPFFDETTCQCGAAPVFIAGDANDEIPLLHTASEGGEIAGLNAAAWPSVTARRRTVPLVVMYCEPQIATVGQTYRNLTENGRDFVTGAVDWSHQGRANIFDEAQGRLHVYAGRDGAVLGAEMVGPRSEHLAHLLALAIEHSLTLANVLAMPFYHPTFEEGLRTALRDAVAKI